MVRHDRNATLERLRSPRTLLIAGGVLVGAVAVAASIWLWSSLSQSRGLAAYAEAMTRAEAGQLPDAPPSARAQAIRELEAVLAEYPGAAEAADAAYQLGNLRYANREFAAARAAYEIALAKQPPQTVRLLAQAGIAYTWEAERNFSKAAESFRAGAEGLTPSDFVYEDLWFGLARSHEMAGQKDAAIATYRQLLKDVPKSRRADMIRARLSALGATG